MDRGAWRATHVVPVLKNPPTNAGDVRDVCSIPGSGRFAGGGHGTPFQYTCLENPMGRGIWQATFHGVSQSQTHLKSLRTHARSRLNKQEKISAIMNLTFFSQK